MVPLASSSRRRVPLPARSSRVMRAGCHRETDRQRNKRCRWTAADSMRCRRRGLQLCLAAAFLDFARDRLAPCSPACCRGRRAAMAVRRVEAAPARTMTAAVCLFGDFRLDPARRELWRADEQLDLPPKIFDCIAYLIAHRDRAIGRDELIAAVGGRKDVSDNLLDQATLRWRRALGDVDEQRRYIRTMPRFGFRWVADVREESARAGLEVGPQVAQPAPTPPSTTTHAAGTRRLIAWSLLALALLATVVALGWRRVRTQETALPVAALVLPFDVRAEGPTGWVRLGAMDLVAEQLRQGGRLVLPSDNVVALTREGGPWTRGSAQTAELARVAGASVVVAGEAELAEGRWRVTLRTLFGTDAPVAVE